MIQRYLFSFLVSFFLYQTVVAQTAIFNASPSVQPGSALSLQGNFSASAKAFLYKGASTSQVSLPILVQSDNHATVQIPANLGMDLYQVWITDNGQNSAKVYVNQAWGMHFDSPEVAPDGTLRIFGRNLQLSGASPKVRFVASNGASLDAAILSGDAYSLTVKAPSGLQPGTVYSVWVSNGLGGAVGETKVDKTITAIKAGSDYFNLNVGWAAKLDFYKNVYNVKTDSRLTTKAKGDGTTSDYKVIRDAIKKANADGGGIVYLPAGTYKLDFPDNFEGIRMMDRVVLQGAGKDQTIITFGHNTNSDKVGIYWSTNVKQAGIADLTLLNIDNDASLITNMRGKGSEMFLQRIRFDLAKSNWIWLNGCDKLVIANSDFTHGVDNQFSYRGPFMLNTTTNFVIANNTITYAVDGINIDDTHGGVFENNKVYRDGSARYPTTVVNHVLVMNFAENVAVLNNLFKVINGPAQNSNDGETIIAEGGGKTRPDEDAGTVSGASATTLRDDSKNWGTPTQIPVVAIVNGKGMGQWRRIVSRQGNTLNLDRPWDVLPSAGSRYAIFNWGGQNWLIKGNTLEGNRRGITLYKNATTQVAIVSNTLLNSGSIDLMPSQQMRGSTQTFIPMYNNQIVDNTVSNTDLSNGNFIGIHPVQHSQEKTFGTASIGLEMRNNRLTAGIPNVGAIVDGDPYPEGYLNYLEYHPPGKFYVDEQIPSVLGSILENNTAINCDHAIYVNSATYNTYVCGTNVSNVKNLVDDEPFDKVTHGAIRTASCTPILAQLTADAGPDQTLVLPTNSIVIAGVATSSPADNIASVSWLKLSGPNPAISGNNTLNLSLSKMPAGTYVFRLTVTDKTNRQVTDEVTITVAPANTVQKPSVEQEQVAAPVATPQTVVSFSLMNADTDQEIKVLAPEETLNLAALPTRNLNIRVNTSSAEVGSVKMELTGTQTKTQTETEAPYALFGDTKGDYKNWTPAQGNYSLKVTPYTQASGQGTAGKALTINFSVVDLPVNQPPVAPASINTLSAQVGTAFPSGALAAFTDPEGSPLTYTLSGLPDGLTFSASARSISGTPKVAGNFTLTYTATDPQNASTRLTISLTVSPAPTATVTGNFEGFLDEVGCGIIRGWVWDKNKPNQPVTVELYSGNTVWTTTVANLYRDDLKAAGKGNGMHAYSLEVPASLKGTGSHVIYARVKGSTYVLKQSGKSLNCPSPARLSAEEPQPLEVVVLGNPVSQQVQLEIKGAEAQPVKLLVTDLSGRIVAESQVAQAGALERHTLAVSQAANGLLLLQVSTPKESKTVKLLKVQ